MTLRFIAEDEARAVLAGTPLRGRIGRRWPEGGGGGVLLLPPKARLPVLPLDELDALRVSVVLAPGDLDVGVVINGELDFGPLLLVGGTLRARHAAVGGAAILVGGALEVAGCFHGSYNHGELWVGGRARVGALVRQDGYKATFRGGAAGDLRGATEPRRDAALFKALTRLTAAQVAARKALVAKVKAARPKVAPPVAAPGHPADVPLRPSRGKPTTMRAISARGACAFLIVHPGCAPCRVALARIVQTTPLPARARLHVVATAKDDVAALAARKIAVLVDDAGALARTLASGTGSFTYKRGGVGSLAGEFVDGLSTVPGGHLSYRAPAWLAT